MELVGEQLKDELPFAVYSLPGSDLAQLLIQTDRDLVHGMGPDCPGFHVAPYQMEPQGPLVIRPDFFYTCSSLKPIHLGPAQLPPEDIAAKELHANAVSRILEEIHSGQVEKVVLSRRFSVPLHQDLIQLVPALVSNFTPAFRYLWYHPEAGMWLGASPELLLEYDGKKARSVSLAGTLPVRSGESPYWGGKEQDEQQIVTDYILQCFRDEGVVPSVSAQESVQAGALWHLRTKLEARIPASGARQLASRLHPTPAVCGLPLQAARTCIEQVENYDREYYCGFVGINGLETVSGFRYYVNLRCAQLRGDTAFIYVGGGITADSIAGSEWMETREKSRTVLSLLQNNSQPIGE